MTEKTARKYRDLGGIPARAPRTYRTRKDPFESVWPEIERLLEASPGLEAVTIFDTLRLRADVSFGDGQLRTLQRRIRRWRASRGPEKEVMFSQEHRPGEAGQSDFTDMRELEVRIGREPFDHLLYHFVLPYSNWESAGVCFTESFESLVAGLQGAVWEMGRVPRKHRTDNLSAATHELKDGGRSFNERYKAVLDHYGMAADRNTPGRGHENGDVEQSHHRLKRALDQALMLRGGRDFDSRGEYEVFLGKVIEGRNRGRREKYAEELAVMKPLPLTRLCEHRTERVGVSVFSTIRVANNVYSVPSRLISERVEVRLYAETVEVFYAGERVCAMERLRGSGNARIDYRHLIFSLVRKPGAFARYRYREALFPTVTFRRAYDALVERLGEEADLPYVRILHLAATTTESGVEETLSTLLERGELAGWEDVKERVRPETPTIPECQIPAVDLRAYDFCLEGVPS
ncbi:MAG: IS21 family transposase [Holophagales bacterium]|nr:IS21 family transposase [Holophagales bacterium]